MLQRLRLDWRTVAMGVLTALLSLVIWQANNSLGRLEAAEAKIAEQEVRDAQKSEILLYLREDVKEIKRDVKEILREHKHDRPN